MIVGVRKALHERGREEAFVEGLEHEAVVGPERGALESTVVVRAAPEPVSTAGQRPEEVFEGGPAVRVGFPHDDEASLVHPREETCGDHGANTVRQTVLQMDDQARTRTVVAHDRSHNTGSRSAGVARGRGRGFPGALGNSGDVGLEKKRSDHVVDETEDGRAEAAARSTVRRRSRHGRFR